MSSGRLQIVAAALLAASAFAASAAPASDPDGSWRALERPGALESLVGGSWARLELSSVAPAPFAGGMALSPFAPHLALAGATLRDLDGWSASLFVSRAFAGPSTTDELVRFADTTAVNARFSRRLSRATSVTLDVFNLFDRRQDGLDAFVASNLWSSGGMPEDFLVHPGEPRGIRLGVRRTFR